MMICPSKCRPLNTVSIGWNRSIPYHCPAKVPLHQSHQIYFFLFPSTPAENASQPAPAQAPRGPLVGLKLKPKRGESKNEASIGSAGPNAFVGVVLMYSTSVAKNTPSQLGLAVFVHTGT